MDWCPDGRVVTWIYLFLCKEQFGGLFPDAAALLADGGRLSRSLGFPKRIKIEQKLVNQPASPSCWHQATIIGERLAAAVSAICDLLTWLSGVSIELDHSLSRQALNPTHE